MMKTAAQILSKFLDPSQVPSEESIRRLWETDPEIAVFVMLELLRRVRSASSLSPATPSGMIPVYQKPAAKGRKKKPGRKDGHKGARRPAPPQIDQRVEHRLERCPDCDGELRPCTSPHSVRTRIIEDIPTDIHPVVTEHVLHRDY